MHSLTSSTIAVEVADDSVDATLSLPLATLDRAMGTDYASDSDIADDVDDIEAYLAEHLAATGADGTAWSVTFDDAERETIEGIDSLIELAQLTCVALVFPSLYVLSRTRFHPAFRVSNIAILLAGLAIVAQLLDRELGTVRTETASA